MNSAATIKNSSAPAAAKMPSELVRSLVTLWLLFHLLGITLALCTNLVIDPPTSTLVARVKSAPFISQYLYGLWLDVPHSYALTEGETDGDYSIKATLNFADGHTETETFPSDADHGEVRERYQVLARRVASGADEEEISPTSLNLLQALGGGILRQNKEAGLKEVVFGVDRRAPLTQADANGSDVAQRDPLAARTLLTLYTASVRLDSRDQPQVQILARAARDVAPVTNPRSPGASRRSAPRGGSSSGQTDGGSTNSGAAPSDLNKLKGLMPSNTPPDDAADSSGNK